MKYKKIIVCVDKEKHLEYATTIVTYLSSLGIKTSLRIGCIEGCILPEYKKHKNTVFVCLSPVHYLFYNKKNRLGCMSDKYIIDDEVLKLLKTKKLSDINMTSGSLSGNLINLSMSYINLSNQHPFRIFIHEFLHLYREKECPVKECMGASCNEKSKFGLCPKCRKDFKEVIKMFK